VVSLKQASAIGVGIHSTLSRLTRNGGGCGGDGGEPLGLGMASKAEYERTAGAGTFWEMGRDLQWVYGKR
jgi:hypothetical protein